MLFRSKLMHDVECEFDAGLQRPDDAGQPSVYMVKLAVPLPKVAS